MRVRFITCCQAFGHFILSGRDMIEQLTGKPGKINRRSLFFD
ncbi:hypothetical protein D1BOALGB6SA_10084 [Olavius sp. associated proteobacterium Delta 1]|nr:hypothetical protein D1BOALGB6SA_10084 [Olavius sp. associated proteobacterium Delta 1]